MPGPIYNNSQVSNYLYNKNIALFNMLKIDSSVKNPKLRLTYLPLPCDSSSKLLNIGTNVPFKSTKRLDLNNLPPIINIEDNICDFVPFSFTFEYLDMTPHSAPECAEADRLPRHSVRGQPRNKKKKYAQGKRHKPSHLQRDYRMHTIWEDECIHPTEAKYTASILSWEKRNGKIADVEQVTRIFNDANLTPHAASHLQDPPEIIDGNILDSHIVDRIQELLSSLPEDSQLRYFANLIEDIAFTCVAINETSSTLGVTVAVLDFIKKRGDGCTPLLSHAQLFMKDLFSTGPEPILTDAVNPNLVPHSGWEIGSALHAWRAKLSHPLFRQLSFILSFMVTAGLISEIEFNVADFNVFKIGAFKAHETATDIIDGIFATLIFFIEKGYACFLKGSLTPLWQAKDDISTFEDNAAWLAAHVNDVKCGNLFDITGKDECYFQELLNETRQRAIDLFNSAPNSTVKSLIGKQRTNLGRIYSDFHTFTATSGMRMAPYCYLLYGTSGVGKTTLSATIMAAVLQHNGYPCEDKYLAVLQNDDKFYSTYKSSCTGLLLDDMCNTRPEKSAVNPASRIIELVNNVKLYANKAAVDEKGKVFIKPKIVSITTNNTTLDAGVWSCEPVSVLRRVHCRLIVKVRPEYATDKQIDRNKIEANDPTPDDNIKDVWLLTLQKLVPVDPTIQDGPQEYFWETQKNSDGKILENVSIFDALAFMCINAGKHYEDQKFLVNEFSEYHEKVDLCRTCARRKGSVAGQVGICKCDNPRFKPEAPAESLKPHAGLIFGTPQVDIVTTLAATVITRWAGTMYKEVMEMVFPTKLEATMLNAMDATAVFCYTEKLGYTPYVRWMDYLPDSIAHSDAFRMLFPWLNRRFQFKKIRNWTIMSIAVSYPILFGMSQVTGYSPLYITAGMAIPMGAFTRSTMYYHAMAVDQLHRRRFSSCILSNSTPASKAISKLVKHGALLAAGITAIKLGRAIWQKIALRDAQPHSTLDPKTPEEVQARSKHKDPWPVKVKPLPDANALSRCRTSLQLINTVCHSLLFMRYTADGTTFHRCNTIFVDSNIAMMPYHCWFPKCDIYAKPYEYMDFEFIRSDIKVPGYNFKDRIYFAGVVRVSSHDLCLAHVASGGTWPSLLKVLPNEIAAETQVECAYREPTGLFTHFSGRFIPSTQKYKVEGSKEVEIRGGGVTYGIPTFEGMCMTPLASDNVNTYIIGFHIAGATGIATGAAVSPTRPEVELAISLLRKGPGYFQAHSSGSLPTRVLDKPIGFAARVDSKAPISYIDTYHANIYGTCSGMATTRSAIRESILAPGLTQTLGFANKWGPPNLRPQGQSWKPWYDTLIHLVDPRHNVNPSLLEYAKKDYLSGLLNKVNIVGPDIRKLTHMETVCGRDGVRFIDAMNMSTSIGFPLGGVKSDYINILDTRDYPDFAAPKEFSKELNIEGNILECEETYLKGIRCYPIFKACLKDEATKIGKDKVRVFESAPIVLQCLIRKYFLSLVRFISLFPLVSECAVGINSHGNEWQEMHDHIVTFGEHRILAGDYSKWDLRLPAHLVGSAFDILIKIAQASGNYSTDDITIMQGIATDVTYPVIAYNGTLLELFGSNPSGQNLTAHLNSICNSLLIRMAFVKLEGPKDFRSYVKIITYGDDLIGSVSKECKTFNHITVRDFLKDLDIEFTMPDKKSEAIPFLHIDNADFLKRKSVLNPEMGQRVGALELDSIYKSLYCYRVSAIGEKNVMCSAIQSALLELTFHGRDVYNANVDAIKPVALEVGVIVPELNTTYDERILKWRDTYNPVAVVEDTTPVVGSMPDNVDMDLTPQSGDFPIIERPFIEALFQHGYLVSTVACWNGNYHIYESANSYNRHFLISVSGRLWFITLNIEEIITEMCGGIFLHPVVRGYCTEVDTSSFSPHSGAETVVEYTDAIAQPSTSALHFDESLPGHEAIVYPDKDDTFKMASSDDVNLRDFLARPIRIATISWAPATTLSGSNTLIMNSFLTDKRVANRISNYAHLNCTVNIRVVTTGSPMHYGMAIVALNPYPNADNALNKPGANIGLTLNQIHQLPHIIVDTTTSSAGELSMPLMLTTNMLNLTDADQISSCLGMQISSYTPLQVIGTGSDPVTITVWMWLTEVELGMPTCINIAGLVPQSGDEYGKTPISYLATTVASMAGMLEMVPIIGRYARATEMVASTIGSVARMFGYSRPNRISEEVMVQMRPYGNMSNFNVTDTSVKLALDCKNEVTIDPCVLGVKLGDEMTIKSLVSREGFIGGFSWASGTTSSNPIWKCAVTPTLCMTGTSSVPPSTTLYDLTPLAFTALPFKHWRGTIKFRFVVVASAFHRGRLRFVYDPLSNMNGAGSAPWNADTNLNHSQIVDISTDREFIMEVGWGSIHPYIDVANLDDGPWMNSTTSDIVVDSIKCNGAIAVHAVSPLMGGLSNSASVYVLVFVSAGDDFELAVPNGTKMAVTTTVGMAPQSGKEPTGAKTAMAPSGKGVLTYKINCTAGKTDAGNKLASICFGERIVSIRQVIKRYSAHSIFSVVTGTVGFLTRGTWIVNDFPVYKGYDLASLTTSSTGPYNFARDSYMNWFTQAYLARRGSIRHKYVADGFTVKDIDLTAVISNAKSASFQYDLPVLGSISKIASHINYAYSDHRAGSTANIKELNPVLEFETPYYSPKRFHLAQNRNKTSNIATIDGRYDETYHAVTRRYVWGGGSIGSAHMSMTRFVSAGDDYQLHFYKYAPQAAIIATPTPS